MRWTEGRGRVALGRMAVSVCLAAAACAPPRVDPGPPPPLLSPGLPTSEPEVKIGLAVDADTLEIGVTGGYRIVEASSGRTLSRGAGANEWLARVSSDAAVTLGGEAASRGGLVVEPAGDALVTVAENSYRGSVLLQSRSAGRLTAVNLVALETYLLGVVPREIGQVGEELFETAKAQAVAARTYAIAHLGRRSALGFDLYATVADQAYGGASVEHGTVSRAVFATGGEILVYDGEPIEAYYHSTCAGRTAAIEEVWDADPEPYLKSVIDVNPRTGESYDRSSRLFEWTVRWTASELEQILSRTLADSLPPGTGSVGEIHDLRVAGLTPSGRVARLVIETENGTFVSGRDRVRWILERPEGGLLYSSKFEVEVSRGPDGRVTEVVADGGGWGHGIGMCQVGAMGRDRAGQGYREILAAYYRDARVRELY
ncbi:MAG: SpoIID/LytB domain-containing protein [Longimicrobiaceae bacterium]